MFDHPIEAHKEFEGLVRDGLHGGKVLVVTDIENYFEKIKISDIVDMLKSNIPRLKTSGTEIKIILSAIATLEKYLKTWSYDRSHGLPQNRDASSFLANMIMSKIDRVMSEDKGYDYYRYMDDIRIVCKDKYHARRALKDLIIMLRELGLNVNSAKTEILEPDEDDYKKYAEHPDRQIERIDSMWKSRSRPVILRSFAPLREFALKQVRENKTHEKAFRFCVRRLESLALCSEIAVPNDFFDLITDAVIDVLLDQPFSSDQLTRYLKSVNLGSVQLLKVKNILLDDHRAVYGWQNYHLWQLATYKNHRDSDLISLAKRKILDSKTTSEKAGAVLYTGAMGNEDDRVFIADHFECFNDAFTQRNALIAIHELDYSRYVKDRVGPKVMEEVKGTYKRMRDKVRGKYSVPLEAISYKRIYDEVSGYE